MTSIGDGGQRAFKEALEDGNDAKSLIDELQALIALLAYIQPDVRSHDPEAARLIGYARDILQHGKFNRPHPELA